MGRVLFATLGFDADLVLRRVRSGNEYTKIKCLGLRVDDTSFKRVENAFSTVKFVAERLGISAELRALEPGRGLMRGILAEIEREAAIGEVEVYLSGGPRLLVVATLIATLLVDLHFIENILIVVEGEAFEGEIRSKADWLKELVKLSGEEVNILNYVAGKGRVKPPDLVRDLDIPKATAYKKLRKFTEKKFLKEESDGYTLSEQFLEILF